MGPNKAQEVSNGGKRSPGRGPHSFLELAQPIQVPPGAKVLVAIGVPELVAEDHQAWIQMSIQRLASTYGPNEPEYSPDLIKTPNPEFRS
jgi:hypothetical protein